MYFHKNVQKCMKGVKILTGNQTEIKVHVNP